MGLIKAKSIGRVSTGIKLPTTNGSAAACGGWIPFEVTNQPSGSSMSSITWLWNDFEDDNPGVLPVNFNFSKKNIWIYALEFEITGTCGSTGPAPGRTSFTSRKNGVSSSPTAQQDWSIPKLMVGSGWERWGFRVLKSDGSNCSFYTGNFTIRGYLKVVCT